MGKLITESFSFESNEFGTVRVVAHSRARNIILRRKDGCLQITVPRGTDVDTITPAIIKMLPKLPAQKVQRHYSEGDCIEFPEGRFTISTQGIRPSGVMIMKGADGFVVNVGKELDITSPAVTKIITKLIIRTSKLLMQLIVLPAAQRLAHSLHCHVKGWRTGNGLRTLGTCSAGRIITLSAAVLFLPVHLRRYIVCHELAHLTEMNHSERFHDLCNRYCDGKAKALEHELKHFKWPIIR